MIEKTEAKEVLRMYKKLEEEGHEVYFVGGCVRDLLIGKKTNDWDLATSATPEQIQKLFPRAFYDNTYGTVGIPFQEKVENTEKNYAEITTFRSELGYSDRRHPDKIAWGTSIIEDLSRRDFTVNAIAARLKSYYEVSIENLEIIDPYHGQQDLAEKVIRTVGLADDRFREDALRLMRAIRFSAQLGFTIEKDTWSALTQETKLITHVSYERIRDELLKILASHHPYEGIMLLDKSGILDLILPELARGKGVSQTRPGRHHTTDVFTHNILSLKHTTSIDPFVRLAVLLHDVGKPYVKSSDEKGLVIFYNHEVEGAKLAAHIADRLRLSKKQKEKIVTLIRWHMFTVDEHITDSAVRRFIRRVGLENVKDIIDLRIGDRLGSGTQKAESWRLKKFKERIEEQLHPPFSINDLAVDGTDVMRELSIKPGPKVGEILQKLFEETDRDLSKNNREYLLKRIKKVV